MNIENVKNILKNIPIFWINLERAKERKNKMEALFKKYDLQAEKIEAIDGNDINLEEYKKIYKINDKMNVFEVACALSHIKTIQTCYDKNLDYALILEDDVIFDYFDYKKNSLMFLLEELAKVDGDCIQLCNIVNKKSFATYASSKKILIKSHLDGAPAYLINKNGMKKVLDNFTNTKTINVSERMIFDIINTYITKPYFSYPFLKDCNGKTTNVSFIRENNKSAQTIGKLLVG